MSFNTELFIELVRSKSFLYDSKDVNHRNHHMLRNAWESIVEEMGIRG